MPGTDSRDSRWKDLRSDSRVCVMKVASSGYGDRASLQRALERAAAFLGWGDEPGRLLNHVSVNERVVVKPNWVMHRNEGAWGTEPLLTNAALIEIMTRSALDSEAERVLVGDAPLQRCDFQQLLLNSGVESALSLLRENPRFAGIDDLRRTSCEFISGVRVPDEGIKPLDDFVQFDLEHESLLEDVTSEEPRFRVTCYDPNLLARTHSRGRHQYLVARQVMEAGLVINMPKLKTHKKAGMTCALKNLIGINGNKEYLPHHRVGGSESGGDCYPGTSALKSAVEYSLDRMNSATSFGRALLWSQAAGKLTKALAVSGDEIGVEGSWSGNDTIWRTCLDLNRILVYGTVDGEMSDSPQRNVIHVVDAIVAGQGDGPLKPEPLPLGLIIAGNNAAAVDWIGAAVLGYDPHKIPSVINAFSKFRWPLADFDPPEILVTGDLGNDPQALFESAASLRVRYPVGWRDAVMQRNDGRVAGPA